MDVKHQHGRRLKHPHRRYCVYRAPTRRYYLHRITSGPRIFLLGLPYKLVSYVILTTVCPGWKTVINSPACLVLLMGARVLLETDHGSFSATWLPKHETASRSFLCTFFCAHVSAKLPRLQSGPVPDACQSGQRLVAHFLRVL